jgi:phosphoribosylpyrophosphate synthetase
LIIKVFEMDLNVGLTKRLVDLLEDALVAFDEGGEANALVVVNALEDFIALVEKEREKKLTNEQAESLVADAVAIIEQITNPVEPPADG